MDEPPSTGVLAVIEVVSKDDKYVQLLQKLEDYRVWGVPYIWVVDPWLRRLAAYETNGLRTVEVLNLVHLNVTIRLEDLQQGLPILHK